MKNNKTLYRLLVFASIFLLIGSINRYIHDGFNDKFFVLFIFFIAYTIKAYSLHKSFKQSIKTK